MLARFNISKNQRKGMHSYILHLKDIQLKCYKNCFKAKKMFVST